MPQMAVGENERLLGSDGGDEELMCMGLPARRAPLTTSPSPATHTRPPLPHPFILAAAFRGTFPTGKVDAWISKDFVVILGYGQTGNRLRSHTLSDTFLDRKCVHIQFLSSVQPPLGSLLG